MPDDEASSRAHAMWVRNDALSSEERDRESYEGVYEMLALVDTIPEPDEWLTARARTHRALLHSASFEYAAALEQLAPAVEVCRHLVEQDPDVYRPTLIAALEQLYVAQYGEAHDAEAAAAARELVAQLRSQSPDGLPRHQDRLAEALSELSGFERVLRNWQAATDAANAALEMYESGLADARWAERERRELEEITFQQNLFRSMEIAARGGVADMPTLSQQMPGLCSGTSDDYLWDRLLDYTQQQFREHRTRQESWTEPTLNDGIDQAFAELDASGIIALQDAGPTTSAGWSNVNDTAYGRDGVRGAVFYHHQDLVRAVDGAGLCLAFGALTDDEQASVAIGHEVRKVLEQHGVPVEWTGSAEDRLEIPPFEWRKRR